MRSIEDYAAEMSGNWLRFKSFAWWGRQDASDRDKLAVVYLANSQSGLLATSNAWVIEAALAPFTSLRDDQTEEDRPDVVFESHSHWAVSEVSGFSIRVYAANGSITEAFKTYYALQAKLENYPILDEEDYGRRQDAATTENINDAAHWFARKHEIELPENSTNLLLDYFDSNNIHLSDSDDMGGYPTDEQLEEAFAKLGWKHAQKESFEC